MIYPALHYAIIDMINCMFCVV